jgi:arylsulfatase A-like enzyme
VLSLFPGTYARSADSPSVPNIVLILADDLGYGDVGCYGQRVIRTPNLDRMAAEGIRFTDCYAGSTVCAPSRCVLMTGLHSGHARIRGNLLVPLEPNDVTVAEVLHQAGYATGIVGKWGLGEEGTAGIPRRQGFDYWFGYLNQVHAHNYYPAFLWRNETQVRLPNEVPEAAGRPFGTGVATRQVVYSHDLFLREALTWIEQHAKQPFFLYFAVTLPHANNEARDRGMEVPDYGPYAGESWPDPEKGRAAMITRLDTGVGQVLAKIRQLGLDRQTLVFFASDNGPHKEGGSDPEFFHSSGTLTGIKRSLHEGGIRVPMIVRWPGHITAGRTSDLPWAFWDVLPTLAELGGAKVPAGIDGLSVVPTLLEQGTQRRHEFLYWEFHEGPSQQAVRMGPWKAIRPRPSAPLQLYDLRTDRAEHTDLAAAQPAVVAQIETYLRTARTESVQWPLQERRGKAGKQKTKPH